MKSPLAFLFASFAYFAVKPFLFSTFNFLFCGLWSRIPRPVKLPLVFHQAPACEIAFSISTSPDL